MTQPDADNQQQSQQQSHFEPEQLTASVAESLYAAWPLTIAGTAFLGVTLSAYLAWSTGNVIGWVLLAAFAVVGIARFMLRAGYRANRGMAGEASRSVGAAIGTLAISGICWGGLVLVFFDPQLPKAAVAIGVSTVAVAIVHLLLLSSSLSAMLAFALPALVPLLVKLVMSGMEGIVSALLLIVATGLGIAFSSRHRRQLTEVVTLRQADRQLREQLEKNTSRMETLAGERGELVSQRDGFESQLGAAKREAEAAAMAKDEFLATMSHEIRTPLNGIMPLLDLLRGTQLDEAQRDYLNTAFISSKHLLSIIDDILDFSKVEAGKLELEVVGMNLRELLDSVAKMMSGSASRKGLELRTRIDPSVRLAMRGDPVRLRQILTNLVSNAIKFTERGHIEIAVTKKAETRTETELTFSVEDTGIGMDEAACKRLFKPFSQADASTTRHYGGTGLGLAICKRLVEMMDGDISVTSQPNKGSTFSFTARLKKSMGDINTNISQLDGKRLLAVSTSDPYSRRLGVFAGRWGSKIDRATSVKEAVDKIKLAYQKGAGWTIDALLIDVKTVGNQGLALAKKISESKQLEAHCLLFTEDGQVPAAVKSVANLRAMSHESAEGPIHDRLEGMFTFDESDEDDVRNEADYQASSADDAMKAKILLVEDNPINLHVAQKLLDAIGLEFDVAENGRDGIEKIKTGGFDAVMMDCMMPIMDGYTATRRWRAHEAETGASERLPIIAMTANAMAGDRQRCLDSGMDDYMSKPLNRKLVVETLRRWIGNDSKDQSNEQSPAAKPQPAPATDVVLDQATLKDLREVMEEELGDLIRVYLQDSPPRVKGIREAAAAREVKPLIELAHTLKSTSANLGANELTEVCRQIEEAAKADEVKQAVAAAATLSGAYDKVAAALEEYRGTL